MYKICYTQIKRKISIILVGSNVAVDGKVQP